MIPTTAQRALLLSDVTRACARAGWLKSETARLLLTLSILDDAGIGAMVAIVRDFGRMAQSAIVLGTTAARVKAPIPD